MDIRKSLSSIEINPISLFAFVSCALGTYLIYNGKIQEGAVVIGLILLIQLPFPIERKT